MKRVIILGPGGAGKTTLAQRLSQITGIPRIEIDAHFWLPGPQPTPPEEWAAKQDELIRNEEWIIDGDLGPYDVIESRLRAADTVIFLDFPIWLCAWRAFRRGPERADFWFWLFQYRRKYRTPLLQAISDFAPSASLLKFRSPAELERFVAETAATVRR